MFLKAIYYVPRQALAEINTQADIADVDKQPAR